MPGLLDGVLGVLGVLGELGVLLPGARPAAVGCDACEGAAGAPAVLTVDVDSCAPSFGALPPSEPQATKLMNSAASGSKLLRRECLSE
jgi:hypothetical protein